MSKNKEKLLYVMSFLANKVPINEKTVKDIYDKICSLVNGNIPDDSKVGIRNNLNQDRKISLNEYPEFLVYKFYETIAGKKLDLFDSVVEINSSLIQKSKLPGNLLHTIIECELSNLGNYLKHILTEVPDEKVDGYFEIRFNFLSLYNIENNAIDSNSLNMLIALVNFQIDTAIRRGDIIDKFTILKGYLNKEINDEFKKHILLRYIEILKEHVIAGKDDLIDLFYEHIDLFDEGEKEMILNEINSDPSSVTVHSIIQGGGNTINSSNGIITVIRFIASGKIVNNQPNNFFSLRLGNKKLIGKRILSYLDDPIVNGLNIGGLKPQYVSDYTGFKEFDNIKFQLQINEFVHPQFEMEGDKIIEIDKDRVERLDGRQYHPLKRIVIEFLLDIRKKLDEVFEIPDSDFDINLFSNYSIEYYDKVTRKLLYKRHFFLTNPGAFVSSRKGYFDRLSQLNLSDTFLRVRQLMDNTKIVTGKMLQQFIVRLLKIVVKEAVELSGNYRYFWTSDENGKIVPQKEVEMQPLIFNQLRLLLEFKGINISKEPEYSNGKLDFECSFNSDSWLFKCAIEIKNAHSPKILNGVSKQLPQYMKQTGKYGIFCFLWYKGDQFDKPENYSDIGELKEQLIKCIPEGFKIEVIGVNCNKGPSPSTL